MIHVYKKLEKIHTVRDEWMTKQKNRNEEVETHLIFKKVFKTGIGTCFVDYSIQVKMYKRVELNMCMYVWKICFLMKVF